jgi:hypothetical protein
MGYFFHQHRTLFVWSRILGVIAILEFLLIFWSEWYLEELLTKEFNKKALEFTLIKSMESGSLKLLQNLPTHPEEKLLRL